MKYLIILIMIALFLTGCVNKAGISIIAYPECEENYDLYGVYYYKCHENVYNFKKINPYNLKPKRKICLDCN